MLIPESGTTQTWPPSGFYLSQTQTTTNSVVTSWHWLDATNATTGAVNTAFPIINCVTMPPLTGPPSQFDAALLDRANARRKAKEEADARAKQLLLDFCSEAQAMFFEKYGWIPVVSRGLRQYLIDQTAVHLTYNEKEYDEDGTLVLTIHRCMTFCVHPDVSFSRFDKMLAQKLLIETDEERFLHTANVDRIYGPEFNNEEGQYIIAGHRERFVREHPGHMVPYPWIQGSEVSYPALLLEANEDYVEDQIRNLQSKLNEALDGLESTNGVPLVECGP